jgi:hypothetical protein
MHFKLFQRSVLFQLFNICFRSRQKDISSPVGQLLQKSLHLGDDEQQVPQVSSEIFVFS